MERPVTRRVPPQRELEPWRTHPGHLDIEQNGGEHVFERSHINV